VLALACLVFVGCAVEAAHPLITEDTPTQGAGHWELELGNALSGGGAASAYEFAPQLSYGVRDNLDLIARPTVLLVRPVDERGQGGADVRGFGDASIDLKWRFFEWDANALAVRAGIDVPTGSEARGLGSGHAGVHGLLALTHVAAPWAVHGNLGYALNRADDGSRRTLLHASAAAVVKVEARVSVLVADAAVDTETDPSVGRWQRVLRSGLIWAVRPGLDVDMGYQWRLGGDGPSRVWLAGATGRW